MTRCLAAACIAALAACSSSPAGHPDAGSGITYWLAPNGSEVVLKLDPAKPTTGF
jgi:hypothetical protein